MNLWRMFGIMVLGLAALFNCLLAQPPDTLWTRTFGDTASDAAFAVQQTDDGGYIITGWSSSYCINYDDIFLIKTDDTGSLLWQKTFGGGFLDMGADVEQTGDGGYIIAGITRSYGAGNDDIWLIKTDSAGNVAWDKTFGGAEDDNAHCVHETDDGGFIIAGWTSSYGAGSNDIWLIKTDSAGNVAWDTTFGGTGIESGHSVQQTTDGGYIIAGWTTSYGAGNGDFWLIKTDAAGNDLWSKTLGDTNTDIAYSVQQTTDGGYVITGHTTSYGAGSNDIWLIKTDSAGNVAWDKTFGGTADEIGMCVQQTLDEGYILTGPTLSYGAGSSDIWIIKTDSAGNELWNKTLGGTDYDDGRDIQQTQDEGFIIAGITASYGAGSEDVWLVKLEGIKDTIPPNPFDLISPLDSTIVSITEPHFIWEASSDSHGIRDYEVYIDDTLRISLVDTNWTADYELSEGYHDWYIIAYDNFDNPQQSNQIWSIGIDTTSPVIDSTTQWHDTSYAGPFQINTKVTDYFAGLDFVLLYYKREEDSDWHAEFMHSSGDWYTDTIPAVSLVDDSVKYYIRAFDKVVPGNQSTDPPGAPANCYSFIANSAGIGEEKMSPQISQKIRIFPTLFNNVSYIISEGSPEHSKKSLTLYDICGRKTKLISIKNGITEFGGNLPPGIYFLKAGGKPVGKVVKVK